MLDLAAAVMAGDVFIDFPIVRRGGVLLIAAEGSSEIPKRLQAVLENKYPQLERAPFAWTEVHPLLLSRKAVNELVALAEEAAARIQKEFGLPLVLIAIDTIVTAAGYSKAGDESDSAIGQMIMNVMEQVSQRTGTLVLGLDHFGKNAETGTRGTSAKEGASDVVLAVIGAKSISGEITDTRLATRKLRSGRSGEEFPFTMKVVDLGVDQHGARITTLIVNWGTKNKQQPEQSERWAKSLRLLRQVLMNVLVDHGQERRPFGDNLLVRAVDLEIVRNEFYRSYPAEGDAAKKQTTRQKAFRRAIITAQQQNLVGVRETDNRTWVWLINPHEET